MTILATIIVLGVLIFIHELGHFGAAKLVGVEVQRFSIGLGPRLWGVKWGETEYVLSAIPLGGYVKMGGMEDEVLERMEGGKSKEPRVPGPRDYDGKPIWARTLVISAGVIMNMVFAFAIYTAVAGVWGVREFSSTRVGEVNQAFLPSGAEGISLIPVGAELVSIGEIELEHWGDVVETFLVSPSRMVTIRYVDPAGEVQVRIPEGEEERVRLASSMYPWIEAEVRAVAPGSPAEKGGIEAGDQIASVDGTPVLNWFDFLKLIHARPDEKVELGILRGGRELTRNVTLESEEVVDPETGDPDKIGKIGIYRPIGDPRRASPKEAVVIGYRQTVAVTGMILEFLRDLVTGNVSPKEVGSIVTIGQASGQAAAEGMDVFLSFMALFSINLAVLNLLPIPVLDGGHLIFLAIEALRGGKPLPLEQRLRFSQVGFVVLMGIMVWALSNDFLRLFGF